MMSDVIYSLLQPIEADTYPGFAPPRISTPYIVFRQVSKVPDPTKDSVSIADHYRWQVSCYSVNYAEAEDLAAQVRDALDGFSGIVGTTEIDDIILDFEGYLYEDDQNARLHHFFADYLIIEKK